MKKTKIISVCLCMALGFNILGTHTSICAKSNGANEKKMCKNKLIFDDLDSAAKKNIKAAKEVVADDCKLAADKINSIKDEEIFEVGVSEVLDKYYEKNTVNTKKLRAFTGLLDERADGIINEYQEAYNERKNSDNLDYVTNKIVVNFDKKTTTEEINRVADEMGSDCYIVDEEIKVPDDLPKHKKERLKDFNISTTSRLVIMGVPKRRTVADTLNEYKKYDCVERVNKSYKCELDGASNYVNDPKAKENPKAKGDYQHYLDRINVSEAWDILKKEAWTEQWVAVIDSGFDMKHEDLLSSYQKSYSVNIGLEISKLTNEEYLKTGDHGTKVVGVIDARSNNGTGIAGVASVTNDIVKVMAIKASDDKTPHPTTDMLPVAIYYAISHGADVINMSFGDMGDFDWNIQEAIDTAYYYDIPVVASTGNDGLYFDLEDPRYPVAYDHVIGVGGVASDYKARYADSNYGPFVDVVGPSQGLWTTSKGSKYICDDGTSYSAPIVAATLAMMRAVSFNELSYDNLCYDLFSTAKDIGSAGFDNKFGYGLIDAGKAVKKAYNDAEAEINYQYSIEKAIFDPIFYADMYPDLKAAYGYDKVKLYNHWKNAGRREGRRSSLVFDLKVYLECNPDLLAAFGYNYTAAFNHFVTYGCNEYRVMSLVFHPGYYKTRYPDLANMSSVQLIRHFAWNGIYEGRQGFEYFEPQNFARTYTQNGVHVLYGIYNSGQWYHSYKHVLIVGWQST